MLTFTLRCIDLLATSSQISFYSQTGSEIRWDAARSVGASRQGMKLILSGLVPMAATTTVITVASWLSAQGIWNLMTRWLCSLANIGDTKTYTMLTGPSDLRSLVSNRSRLWTLVGTGITIGLWLIRPSIPYNHMTGALPFTMLGEQSRARRMTIETFPLPELLAEEYWEPANGHYKGWAPTLDDSGNTAYGNNKPAWARGPLPAAFERWIVNPDSNAAEMSLEASNSTIQSVFKRDENESDSGSQNKTVEPRHYFYNPVHDPMRISNLDLEPLGPLQEALKDHPIPINHIVFVFLESGRKDLFPLKNDSHLYTQIRESYELFGEEDEADLHDKLSQITPVAEMLTGEQSGFGSSVNSTNSGLGGLSFDGILSGSTLSAKSRLVNYCGLGPLPVDFMHENDIIPYQPCLMHIMDLFNQRKNSSSSGNSTNGHLEREWETIYAQSVTGEFQAQTRLMDLLGFKQTLYSEDIDVEDAKYFHEDMEKINYFGYVVEQDSCSCSSCVDTNLAQLCRN